jgi:GNAT superfamily N-acetyltransferase
VTIGIRPARPDDAAAIAALSGELGYPITGDEAGVRLEEAGESDLLVADEPDVGVVGWIGVAVHRSVETGPLAEIHGLIVSERIRGQAIGSALLAAAEDWARARGLTRIRVRSNVTRTRTHGFYLARGYGETKRQVVFDKPLDS